MFELRPERSKRLGLGQRADKVGNRGGEGGGGVVGSSTRPK